VFIGLRIALKVINLIVSGIDGNLSVSQVLPVSKNRKVESDMSKSKQLSMSKSDSSLLSLIIMTLEFLVLVVTHDSDRFKNVFKKTSLNLDDESMLIYYEKQNNFPQSKPELYPFGSKQLPNVKSGLSQFRKTLERLNYCQSAQTKQLVS